MSAIHKSELDRDEILELAQRYGEPIVRSIPLEADEYLFQSRQYRSRSRRGEVVMAIQRTADSVLLHRKGWYERGVYRLPTGGIDPGEPVEEALFRELKEETGLRADQTRFLGILRCLLEFGPQSLPFTSYVFHFPHPHGQLDLPKGGEDITDFHEAPIDELSRVAERLRQTPAPRTRWGFWRAVAHDFVHEVLHPSETQQ